MSTTALIRSPSTNSGLTASPKSATPTSPIVLPKLNLVARAQTTSTQTPTPQPSTPGPSTPGQWQHPRMQEVLQRQNKSNFDKRNIWAIGFNLLALAISFALPAFLYPLLPTSALQTLAPYDTYGLLLLRFLLALNMLIALLPLLRTPDTCEDVPLTPAQRQLLGLPPMSRPATPQEQEQWITPPRYTRSRSGTPQSPAVSLRAQASGSPSFFGETPQREGSRSPFGSQQHSPSSLTPLRSGAERRRLSYNARSSPLSASDFDASMGFQGGESVVGSNTPTRKGNRASVGLNSKWLYEKGMGGSRRGSGVGVGWESRGWGTGSVFS